jgi:hypothetical protein
MIVALILHLFVAVQISALEAKLSSWQIKLVGSRAVPEKGVQVTA